MSIFSGPPKTPMYQQPLPETVLTPPSPPTPNSPEAKAAAERIFRQNAARFGRSASILTSPTGIKPGALQSSSYTGSSILGS